MADPNVLLQIPPFCPIVSQAPPITPQTLQFNLKAIQ